MESASRFSVKRAIISIIYSLAPGWAWPRLARKFRNKWAALTLEQTAHELFAGMPFPITQKEKEIVTLLGRLESLKPETLCEIGAAGGGSLFLFCRAASSKARILSLDIAYTPVKMKTFKCFASDRQKITCLKADSHDLTAIDKARKWLNGGAFDFLFIDGDHTFESVRRDYDYYAPFVRRGGLIAFHDIAEDARGRTGGVPALWKILKSEHPESFTEIVENHDQNGFGIGVLVKK